MVGRAFRAILLVILGALMAVVTFAVFVLPFYGVFEPLLGATAALVLLGVLVGSSRHV